MKETDALRLEPDSLPSRLLPLAVAIPVLSAAVHWRNGLYTQGAVALLLTAVALFAYAAIVRGLTPARIVNSVLVFGLLVQVSQLLAAPPLNDVRFFDPATSARVYYAAWAVAAIAGLAIAAVSRRWLGLCFALVLAAVAIAGGWAITTNVTPRVDVFYYQQDAAAALLRGENPYTLTFPNPYTPDENWVFAPGTVSADGGTILFGFPYLPLSVLGVLPGYLIGGDYRWAHLAAVLLSAALLAWTFRSRTALLAGALLLTHPRMPWYFEWGWTEPLVGLLLVATVCAAARAPRLSPWLGGLLLAGKQYMPLMFPLTALLVPVRKLRSVVLALVSAAAVSLPLVLWDFGAFWSSAISLQFAQPFRHDALALPALLYDLWGVSLPSWLSLVATFGLSALLAARLTPGPRSFAWAVAACVTLLFVLSKQAFANYYLLVHIAWCIVLAAEATGQRGPADLGETAIEPDPRQIH